MMTSERISCQSDYTSQSDYFFLVLISVLTQYYLA